MTFGTGLAIYPLRGSPQRHRARQTQGTLHMFRSIQATVMRPNTRTWVSAAAGLAFAATGAVQSANAQDTIKVGVLHSLSGTMAISETTLKDTVLFMIDEQNKKGEIGR